MCCLVYNSLLRVVISGELYCDLKRSIAPLTSSQPEKSSLKTPLSLNSLEIAIHEWSQRWISLYINLVPPQTLDHIPDPSKQFYEYNALIGTLSMFLTYFYKVWSLFSSFHCYNFPGVLLSRYSCSLGLVLPWNDNFQGHKVLLVP